MILDTSLLNTQQYKLRIKGKVEQSKERSSALPNTLMLSSNLSDMVRISMNETSSIYLFNGISTLYVI